MKKYENTFFKKITVEYLNLNAEEEVSQATEPKSNNMTAMIDGITYLYD